jgi:lactoylglutathione lyase
VRNIIPLCARLAAAGVPMPRPPRCQRHGENIVAFVEDPDGHRIELVEVPAGCDQQASQELPEPKAEQQ